MTDNNNYVDPYAAPRSQVMMVAENLGLDKAASEKLYWAHESSLFIDLNNRARYVDERGAELPGVSTPAEWLRHIRRDRPALLEKAAASPNKPAVEDLSGETLTALAIRHARGDAAAGAEIERRMGYALTQAPKPKVASKPTPPSASGSVTDLMASVARGDESARPALEALINQKMKEIR